jgi:hypothetical protein
MGDVRRLPRQQLVLVDERGVALRATWHLELGLVVLSVWHGDACTASFRLPIAEAPQLSRFLAGISDDLLDEAGRDQAPNGGVANGG